MIQSQVQLSGTPAAIPMDAAAKPHILLLWMGPWDNPKAFMEMFECVAKVCSWPTSQWVVHLLSLLSGEAQLAAQQLTAANLLEYLD